MVILESATGNWRGPDQITESLIPQSLKEPDIRSPRRVYPRIDATPQSCGPRKLRSELSTRLRTVREPFRNLSCCSRLSQSEYLCTTAVANDVPKRLLLQLRMGLSARYGPSPAR
jgi:hypothetical protein